MWPTCLLVSVAMHAAVFFSVDVRNGTPASASPKAFSLVDFAVSVVDTPPDTRMPLKTRVDAVRDAVIVDPAPTTARDKLGTAPAKDKTLLIEQASQPFYKSSQVSHVAQLQLPLEGVLFSDELALSGRLVLDIAVSDLGKVVNIDVVEASDVSGALRAHMLPLLRDAPFSPAYKDGKPVNSVRRVEFTLGQVIDDPTLGFKSSVSPGFRPKMDERGNILKNQPKP